MEMVACYCNWDIPGVDELPAHNHTYLRGELKGSGRFHERGFFAGQEIMQLVPDPDRIHIWVNWKQICKAL